VFPLPQYVLAAALASFSMQLKFYYLKKTLSIEACATTLMVVSIDVAPGDNDAVDMSQLELMRYI